MSDETPRPAPSDSAATRRRRRDAVFGDVLPDTTSDERDPAETPRGSGPDQAEEWLKRQVPPHHTDAGG